MGTIDFTPFLTMIDNKVKNVLLGNKDQKKCPFCGKGMHDAMHDDLNFASPESLELMCLSILHFLLHILEHVMKVGYRNTIKKWNVRYDPGEREEMERRTMEIQVAMEHRGLPVGKIKPGKGLALGKFK